jgi:hypothetical protein
LNLTKYIKFEKLLTFTFVVSGSILISQLMQRNMKIDPFSEYEQTSTVAFGQFLYWSFTVIFSLLFGILFYRHKIPPINFVRAVLVALVTATSGVMLGTSFVALRKTPLSFGYWLGDLGVFHSLSKEAFTNGFVGSLYPPLWPTLVGNLCRLLGLEVDPSYKLISLLSLPLFIAVSLLILQRVFPPILAELISLFTAISFGIFGFKTAGNLWTQLAILWLIKVVSTRNYEDSRDSIKFGLKLFSIGVFFGCSLLLYYGRFWWIISTVAVFLFLTNFLKEKRKHVQISIVNFSLGAGLAFIPMYFGVKYSLSPLLLAAAILVVSTVWMLFNFSEMLKSKIANFFVSFISILLVVGLITYRTGDSFKGDTGLYQSPVGSVIPDINLNHIFDLLILLILIFSVTSISAPVSKVLNIQLFFLTSNLMSTLFMLVFFAFRMFPTGKVELWPRAVETISQTWEIFIVVLIFVAMQNLYYHFQSRIQEFSIKVSSERKYLISTSIFLAVASFQSIELSQYQFSLFPNPGSYTIYSYMSVPTFVER